MTSTVSTASLDKADVLAALFNAATPQAMGFLAYSNEPMTRDQAADLLDSTRAKYFDYLQGRVMRVDLSSDEGFDPYLYDRDNGQGAAARVIAALRATADTNPPAVRDQHNASKHLAATVTRAALDEPTTTDDTGPIPVLSVGLTDVADLLRPAIDRATRED